jgi:hypothetical protein
LTGVRGRNITVGIEWRTYTPDGRVITVRRSDEGWRVECEGQSADSTQLIDALRDAVGSERGEGLLIGAKSNASLEQWLRETAAHIVGDTMH